MLVLFKTINEIWYTHSYISEIGKSTRWLHQYVCSLNPEKLIFLIYSRSIILTFRTFQNTMHTCSIKQYHVASVMSINCNVCPSIWRGIVPFQNRNMLLILDSKWTYRCLTPKYMYMHFLKIQISKKKGWIEEPWVEYIWSVAWKYCIVCLLLNTKRSKPSPIICNSLLTLFIKSFSPEKKINCYKTLDYHILTAPGLKCITVLHVGKYMYIVYI